MDSLIKFFSSIRLTVACLVLGMLLVFFGTMAQVELGLYKAQAEYFRSIVVFWAPKWASFKIPILPGGYLVGGVLVINLITAHYRRFGWTRNKAGLWMVHFGLVLLLVGQLLTDLLARESSLHLRLGETKNFSESDRQVEMVVSDVSQADADTVVAIPQSVLSGQREIQNQELPFTIRVKQFYGNSRVESRPAGSTNSPAATQGVGAMAVVRALPKVTEMDKRDVPSVVVELLNGQTSLGTWLVTEFLEEPQTVQAANRTFQLSMRLQRFYKPYSLQLLKFNHDLYPGTDIPKNFSSRVLLQRADTGEKREVLIYMNNPLRYGGETYYQASYDPDNGGTVLQVVHNPSWLTPYFSCILVGVGLVVHFMIHLLGFTLKRRLA
jgi:hypothetical protein